MSRRRYVSTKISSDTRVNRLAREFGDFAALLYTWMIPHAEDDATLPADPEELLLVVMPGRRDKDVPDVAAAIEAMVGLGLMVRCNDRLAFPGAAFYRYQTYIVAARRGENGAEPRDPPGSSGPETPAPRNSAEQRTTPQTNAPRARAHPSFKSSPSVRDSHSVSVGTDVPTPRALARGSSSPPPADTPSALWVALCETFGADESSLAPNEKKKQMAIAGDLLAQGYSEDKVRRCLAWLKSQEWRTSAIDLGTVRAEIGKWDLNGQPVTAEPAATPPRANGRTRDRPGTMDRVARLQRRLNGEIIREQEADRDIIDVRPTPGPIAGHLAQPGSQ